MRNIILFFIALSSCFIYAQEGMINIINNLLPQNGIIQMNISKDNTYDHFIGIDKLSHLRNKIYHLYSFSKQDTSSLLIPIGSDETYVCFVVFSSADFDIGERKLLMNVNSIYLLYDKNKDLLFYLQPSDGGGIEKLGDFDFEFTLSEKIRPEIVILDSNFMPKSSMKNTFSKTHEVSTVFSKYNTDKEESKKMSKQINVDYPLVTQIPYEELVTLLSGSFVEFDKDEAFTNKYCDLTRLRFFR